MSTTPVQPHGACLFPLKTAKPLTRQNLLHRIFA
jgi:hypothetical protein